ncbi:MAG: hypothetical protein ATN35_07515 [Epulopiscium sp. Nele67-Bin004]|nr:MAG: hypothetical protein ATN35_07515 [Epulopiscium sp. Nele67-Bin004]
MQVRARKKIRLAEYDYSRNGLYFITVSTKKQYQILWEIPNIHKLSSYGKIVETTILNIPNYYNYVSIHIYTIMPNHIHLILQLKNFSSTPSSTVSNIINALKGQVTRQIGFCIWHKSFHDHIIRDINEYENIYTYIQNNPCKWINNRYPMP